MIIFFVVDRLASLEILKGLFATLQNEKLGLLTHAFVSENFTKYFKNFPYDIKLKYVDTEINEEWINKNLSGRVIRFVDSGIFCRTNISYTELFERYEKLNADYGVIIDYLNDKKATLKSAEHAMNEYCKRKYSFNLVGVAQGRSIEEYLKCYGELKKMNYKYIAIGGLLRRKGESNYLGLHSEDFLRSLISQIRNTFNPNWIFTFGIFHPKRKQLLEDLGVWGADYKGWLFQYEEDYSFVGDYLNQKSFYSLFIKQILEHYKLLKDMYKLIYSNKEEKTIIKAEKKLLEQSLRRLDLSLQMFRYMRVRENLRKLFVKRPC